MAYQLPDFIGRTLGQFEIKQQIGQGGMSAVYRAHQPSLNRDVAVKVLSPALNADPSYMKRFVIEAKTSASLEHNNIVPVYDYGTEGDISYIVMRLLTGGTLGERLEHRIAQQAGLPAGSEAVTLMNELTKALRYAHSRGIIHRDIKASNVMFDPQGDPYVVDFGIAQAIHANQNLTASNIAIGTPTYMAPEQWEDKPLTPATDQYALGVLLYYMLTGRLPFYAGTPAALMQKHLNETAPSVHKLRPSLPEKVSDVIARALAKSPEDRFANVAAFAETFEAAMRGHEEQSTDFFRFMLPGKHPAPTPTPPPAAPTVQNQVTPPPAAPTIPNQVAPTPPPIAPIPAAQQPPTPIPSAHRPRSNNWLYAVVGLVVIGAIIGTGIILLSSLSPVTPTQTPATAAGVQPGGIRINPSPDNANGAVPTQITIVGPTSGNAITAGTNDILYNQPEIVVRAVEITPNGAVISAHADGRIRIWAGGTGAAPIVLQEHRGVVNDLAVSNDGRVFISGGDDGSVRVWDANAASYRGVLAGHTSAVRGVALNQDGTRAASASEDGSVRLWDVDAGQQIMTLAQGNIRFFTVSFSPDGSQLAAGDNAGNIIIWDAQSGSEIRRLTGHTESVRSVDYNPNGTQIISGSTDNTVRLWDVNSGSLLSTLRGHDNDVWRVRFSPDATHAASGGRDNNLRLWNLTTATQTTTFTGHQGWVLGVIYSPDGNLLISGGGDGTVRIWNPAN